MKERLIKREMNKDTKSQWHQRYIEICWFKRYIIIERKKKKRYIIIIVSHTQFEYFLVSRTKSVKIRFKIYKSSKQRITR